MNQRLGKIIIRIISFILIVSLGYAVHLSGLGKPQGLYLAWTLVLVFCVAALLEIWLEWKRGAGSDSEAASLHKDFTDASQSFIQAMKAQNESNQKLVEKMDALLQEVPAKLSATTEAVRDQGAQTADSSAAYTEALKGREEELLNSIQQKHEEMMNQFAEVSEKVSAAAGKLSQSSQTLEDSGNLSMVNQSELQAGIEMLNAGLTQILEKVESKVSVHEEEKNFLEKLNHTLEAFHQRSTDILIENSLKTREILLGSNILSQDKAST